jgi:hypothetical protein
MGVQEYIGSKVTIDQASPNVRPLPQVPPINHIKYLIHLYYTIPHPTQKSYPILHFEHFGMNYPLHLRYRPCSQDILHNDAHLTARANMKYSNGIERHNHLLDRW